MKPRNQVVKWVERAEKQYSKNNPTFKVTPPLPSGHQYLALVTGDYFSRGEGYISIYPATLDGYGGYSTGVVLSSEHGLHSVEEGLERMGYIVRHPCLTP